MANHALFHTLLIELKALYTSWLNSMHDEQVEPSHMCAAVTGSQGDTNIVNGKPDCTGAVGDLTPGPTPAKLPGDPSWMFALPLVYSYVAVVPSLAAGLVRGMIEEHAYCTLHHESTSIIPLHTAPH
jgi:hypothetical protein